MNRKKLDDVECEACSNRPTPSSDEGKIAFICVLIGEQWLPAEAVTYILDLNCLSVCTLPTEKWKQSKLSAW